MLGAIFLVSLYQMIVWRLEVSALFLRWAISLTSWHRKMPNQYLFIYLMIYRTLYDMRCKRRRNGADVSLSRPTSLWFFGFMHPPLSVSQSLFFPRTLSLDQWTAKNNNGKINYFSPIKITASYILIVVIVVGARTLIFASAAVVVVGFVRFTLTSWFFRVQRFDCGFTLWAVRWCTCLI